ncbi:MAG TPA: ATP-binding protein [Myxococcota bacterium]|jgi:signal transduction histidine kinase|nr:ATP-binding protein [Myxococcota bacterium]
MTILSSEGAAFPGGGSQAAVRHPGAHRAVSSTQATSSTEAASSSSQGMEWLLQVVQKLSLAHSLEEVTAIVRSAARELTGADGATFVLRDGDRCYYVDEDAIEPLWKGRRFPMSACISGWAMRNRQAVAIEDIYADPRIPVDAYRPTFVKSLAMVPIRSEEPIGAIGNYWAKPHAATAEELRLLQALAHSTSIALANVELYTSLEQRVAERTRELCAANHELAAKNEQLQDLQHQKEALSALLVHDIRSPAATIVMCAEMRLDGDALPERDRRQWTAVRAAGEAITRMATNLLDVAQSEAGGLAVRAAPLELGSLVRDAVATISPLAEGRRQTIALDLPADEVALTGDAELLRRVLQNLLDNGLRYSPGGSRLVVRARVIDEADAEIVVCDEGRGIPPELREHVFEKYVRLSDASAESMGRGLGLAFCRLAVEAHGGRIAAEANEPKGSRFRITLPLRPPA